MTNTKENIDLSLKTAPRNYWRSVRRGLRGKCPRCNKGKVFYKYLKIVDHCPHCKQELFHHRADDLPPYVTITIVGHVVLSLATSVEIIYKPEMWVHMALWLPMALILSLAMLPPIKAGLIGLQWALKLHDFSTDDHSPHWQEKNID